MIQKPKISYSWYFCTSQSLLCVGPAGFASADWRELEDATVDIERGTMIVTADWSRHVMQHHAARVWRKHNLPSDTKLDRKIPNLGKV